MRVGEYIPRSIEITVQRQRVSLNCWESFNRTRNSTLLAQPVSNRRATQQHDGQLDEDADGKWLCTRGAFKGVVVGVLTGPK